MNVRVREILACVAFFPFVYASIIWWPILSAIAATLDNILGSNKNGKEFVCPHANRCSACTASSSD